MAITATKSYFGVVGAQRVWQGSVTFDSSYVTGGEPISAGVFGLSDIDALLVGGTDAAGIDVVWDPAASTLKVFDEVTGTSAEEVNGTDISTVVSQVVVFGR